MIIWDPVLEQHNIGYQGVVKAQLTKYFDGGQLPNQNVTIAQAEVVIENFIDNALSDTPYHIRIHIFSMPNRIDTEIPFNYKVWMGSIGTEPPIDPTNTYWWEPSPEP